jgi:thiol-disulfide isomerase/thioredoxin
MKQYLLCAATSVFLASNSMAQAPQAYNADMLMNRVAHSDTTYIINFWATWCIPCVKELPEFNSLETRYRAQPVKVLLVSLDFTDSYPNKLQQFVSDKQLEPEVIWLNETNANKFIPKIDNRWSGALPATLIVFKNKKRTHFIEDSITEEQIVSILNQEHE